MEVRVSQLAAFSASSAIPSKPHSVLSLQPKTATFGGALSKNVSKPQSMAPSTLNVLEPSFCDLKTVQSHRGG